MKTISIINLKGGVGKSISAINIAYTLAAAHGYRVLLVDNDQQGNSSKFYRAYSNDKPCLSDVLTIEDYPIKQAITHTHYEKLDVLPSNMSLLRANKEILMDTSRPQQTRLADALREVAQDYDYCVIDNAPNLDISVVNALVATDDVLIPIVIDQFTFDGIDILLEHIRRVKKMNASIRVTGGFVTMYKTNNASAYGITCLQSKQIIPVMQTTIRNTVRVTESTFVGKPLAVYAPKCTAARDYAALVDEYLKL